MKTTSPKHVALIMDGNGRWASARGLARSEGHTAGINNIRELVKVALELGLSYITLYSFSTENWQRPGSEVFALLRLFSKYLQAEATFLNKEQIRFILIGDRKSLPPRILKLVQTLEQTTAKHSRLHLTLAFSYGGRREILDAVRKLAVLPTSKLDELAFTKALYAPELPDPDLLIRTGGQQRISNFLLWQLAYTELIFVDTLWPDFGESEFRQCLQNFAQRERRFGKLSSAVSLSSLFFSLYFAMQSTFYNSI